MKPAGLVRPALALTLALTAAAATAGPDPRLRGKSREYKEAIATIERLAKGKKPSEATGSVSAGGLKNAAELPTPGFGYRFADAKRKTHFGTDAMVFGLIELSALWQERHQGAPWFSIGDIAGPGGGRLAPHINHQDGQDIDIAFQYCTPEGEPVDRGWLKCDSAGKTKTATVVFDTARNFEFLVLWLESPWFGGCKWILCFDPLKKLLVEHGRGLLKKKPKNAEAIAQATDQLERLLTQPESSAHDDHFHVRLAGKKPGDDR